MRENWVDRKKLEKIGKKPAPVANSPDAEPAVRFRIWLIIEKYFVAVLGRVSDPDPYPDPDPHGSALI
jgi:hypothetical protein